MSRGLWGLLWAVVATTAMVGNATAQETTETQSCKFMAFSVLTDGPQSAMVVRNSAVCRADPEGASCQAINRIFDRYGKGVSKLVCAGNPAPPEAQIAAREKVIVTELFADVCAMAATALVSGKPLDSGSPVGGLKNAIELCNRSPDKKDCEGTRDFVAFNLNGDAKGLTCR